MHFSLSLLSSAINPPTFGHLFSKCREKISISNAGRACSFAGVHGNALTLKKFLLPLTSCTFWFKKVSKILAIFFALLLQKQEESRNRTEVCTALTEDEAVVTESEEVSLIAVERESLAHKLPIGVEGLGPDGRVVPLLGHQELGEQVVLEADHGADVVAAQRVVQVEPDAVVLVEAEGGARLLRHGCGGGGGRGRPPRRPCGRKSSRAAAAAGPAATRHEASSRLTFIASLSSRFTQINATVSLERRTRYSLRPRDRMGI